MVSSNNELYTNVNKPFPFPDALRSSACSEQLFCAYGGIGSVVTLISKSGTNSIHGDLLVQPQRNFNARNHFATVRDQLKRNQFGGVYRAPIYRDRTFSSSGISRRRFAYPERT